MTRTTCSRAIAVALLASFFYSAATAAEIAVYRCAESIQADAVSAVELPPGRSSAYLCVDWTSDGSATNVFAIPFYKVGNRKLIGNQWTMVYRAGPIFAPAGNSRTFMFCIGTLSATQEVNEQFVVVRGIRTPVTIATEPSVATREWPKKITAQYQIGRTAQGQGSFVQRTYSGKLDLALTQSFNNQPLSLAASYEAILQKLQEDGYTPD